MCWRPTKNFPLPHTLRVNKNNLQYLKTWGGTWSEYGGAQAQTDWDNFVVFVTSNPMTNQTNYNTVKGQYNTGSLIDYFLLNSYIVSSDWLNWNTSWWRGMDPAGDKKKWRYSLWDLDATFDHYINYSWPNNWQSTTTNDPCEPANLLNDPGGQGHGRIMDLPRPLFLKSAIYHKEWAWRANKNATPLIFKI